MYNDQIMMLYMVAAVYLSVVDRPIMAVIVYSLSLSIKAGVLLLLPAFLGQMQMNHGTLKLL